MLSHGREKRNGGRTAQASPERVICARAAEDRRLSQGARNRRDMGGLSVGARFVCYGASFPA
jgi:hypothetical protein